MPIYAYKCVQCGHQQDHLMSMSAEHPKCPACASAQYERQVSAAGFMLKGSGWYATDFKNSQSNVASNATKNGADSGSGSGSGSGCSGSCACHPVR